VALLVELLSAADNGNYQDDRREEYGNRVVHDSAEIVSPARGAL
jgi:hypothetical protein